MNKWYFFFFFAALFGGMFFGITNWPWWACICAGLLTMWICTLIFMAITNATLNSKKELLAEIDRREKLENRFVEDIVSLIELYNYLMPNTSVTPPKGATDKLHQAMIDIEEYMKHRNNEEHLANVSVKVKYGIGDKIELPMEDGGKAIGTIVSVEKGFYIIHFPIVIVCQYCLSLIGVNAVVNFFLTLLLTYPLTAGLCYLIQKTRFIGVLFGYGDRQELTDAGATFIVASPAEIEDLILNPHE